MMSHRSAIFFGLYMLLPMLGKAHTLPQLNLSSPYDLTHTHLLLLKGVETHQEKIGALFIEPITSPIKGYTIAKKLKKLLQKRKINFSKITKDHNYIDPISGKHKYLFSHKLPQVYLIKQDEQWLYSIETLTFMEEYDKMSKIYTLCFGIFPKTLFEKQFCLIAVWQYLLLIGILTMIWVTSRLLPYLLHFTLHKIIGYRTKKQHAIAQILFTLLTLYYVRIILTILQVPHIEIWIDPILKTIRTLIFVCLVYKCVNITQEYIKITKKDNRAIIYLLPFFSMISKIIIVMLGAATTISYVGCEIITIESVVRILSFGALGFSLAAKDTIQNLFGSFMIMVDRPFMIGDEIISGTIRGKVEEIGLRATLLRTKDDSIVYIPNGTLADHPIDNLGSKPSRKIVLTIPLSYGSSFELLPKFIEGLGHIAQCQAIVDAGQTTVYVDDMQTSGLTIIFSIHLHTVENQHQTEKECKHTIIPLIISLAHQLNIPLGTMV